MKKIALVLAAVAALAVPAAQANAAKAPKGPTLAQFNALKKSVATLQKNVKDLRDAAGFAIGYEACLTAVTADVLQGTWQSLDAQLQALGRPAVFGTQVPIDDQGACGNVIPRPHTVPPNVSQFSALTALLGPHYRSALLFGAPFT